MKDGPNIAQVASLMGDPARANMLVALMDGRALSASELAQEAGVTPQTASTHLAKLETGGFVTLEKQGRHRYFRLGSPDVAHALEGLMGLAAQVGHMRTRSGPRDPAMRHARVCYDHLAGELGVALMASLKSGRVVQVSQLDAALTRAGAKHLSEFGIDIAALESARRPMCKVCLDWSERRHHLAGGLGAALLRRFMELGWARREKASRTVIFSPSGKMKFQAFLSEMG
jgi:DNA-binding transcriptional ArsR family regulator